jgi:hypothetical protein
MSIQAKDTAYNRQFNRGLRTSQTFSSSLHNATKVTSQAFQKLKPINLITHIITLFKYPSWSRAIGTLLAILELYDLYWVSDLTTMKHIAEILLNAISRLWTTMKWFRDWIKSLFVKENQQIPEHLHQEKVFYDLSSDSPALITVSQERRMTAQMMSTLAGRAAPLLVSNDSPSKTRTRNNIVIKRTSTSKRTTTSYQ